MRWVLGVLVLVGAVLAAAWLGGETWLARTAAQAIADDPRMAAASVTPLRQIDRIGLRLADVELTTDDGAATLPMLDLWAAPTSPTEFHASLPPQMTLPLAGQPRRIAASAAEASLRLSPGSGMAVSRAAAVSGPVTVDGAALLSRLEANAVLAPMGAGSPQAARASYAVTVDLADLTPAALIPGLPAALVAEKLSAEGRAQVFLTGPLRQDAAGAPPALVGLASDGLVLRVGDREMRVAGSLHEGTEGRAEGALFIDTADPRVWVQLAADLGAISPSVVPLAGTALQTAAASPADLPPGVIAPPAPQAGWVRLPLIFRGGRVFLGPLGLGDAPMFPG